MIRNCGIYSIKRDGAFNAPFVALNDDQALSIVREALEGFEEQLQPDVDVMRIGTLDFFDGIIDTKQELVCTADDILTLKEVSADEISKTV